MGAAGLAAAIWWVGGRILAGQLEPGKFFSFVAAVLLLYTPVKQLGRVGQMAMQGAAAGERIFEILDAPSAVPDDGQDRLAPFRDAIRFERVAFDYGQRPVLHELDLEIRKGEVVALVGASGGGQDDGREPAAALLGRHRRAHHHRREGHPRGDAREPARPARARDAGDGALQRHRPREHRLRPAGGPARRGGARGPARPGARVHRGAAAGLRHARRRAAASSSPAASGSGSPSPARS